MIPKYRLCSWLISCIFINSLFSQNLDSPILGVNELIQPINEYFITPVEKKLHLYNTVTALQYDDYLFVTPTIPIIQKNDLILHQLNLSNKKEKKLSIHIPKEVSIKIKDGRESINGLKIINGYLVIAMMKYCLFLKYDDKHSCSYSKLVELPHSSTETQVIGDYLLAFDSYMYPIGDRCFLSGYWMKEDTVERLFTINPSFDHPIFQYYQGNQLLQKVNDSCAYIINPRTGVLQNWILHNKTVTLDSKQIELPITLASIPVDSINRLEVGFSKYAPVPLINEISRMIRDNSYEYVKKMIIMDKHIILIIAKGSKQSFINEEMYLLFTNDSNQLKLIGKYKDTILAENSIKWNKHFFPVYISNVNTFTFDKVIYNIQTSFEFKYLGLSRSEIKSKNNYLSKSKKNKLKVHVCQYAIHI